MSTHDRDLNETERAPESGRNERRRWIALGGPLPRAS